MARAGPVAGSAILVAALVIGCVPQPSPSPSASVPDAARASGNPAASDAPSSASSPAAGASATATLSGWELLDPAPFTRLEMAVAAHDGRIWLAGGLSPLGGALTDVDVLDPATATWTDGPSLPTGIHHAALVSDGDRLLLIGGYLGASFEQPTEIVLVLDDGADGWTEGPGLLEARAAGAAAWDGERVVYAGGVGPDGGFSSDVTALVDGAWHRIGTMVGPREHLAATSDGAGRTWLMGGRLGMLDTNVATVEVVEGASISLVTALATPRGGVAAFHHSAVGACLTGGETPSSALTVVECVADDGSVTRLPDLVEPHHGHGAAVVDGIVYVLLGGPEPTLSAGSTVERLELAAAER